MGSHFLSRMDNLEWIGGWGDHLGDGQRWEWVGVITEMAVIAVSMFTWDTCRPISQEHRQPESGFLKKSWVWLPLVSCFLCHYLISLSHWRSQCESALLLYSLETPIDIKQMLFAWSSASKAENESHLPFLQCTSRRLCCYSNTD